MVTNRKKGQYSVPIYSFPWFLWQTNFNFVLRKIWEHNHDINSETNVHFSRNQLSSLPNMQKCDNSKNQFKIQLKQCYTPCMGMEYYTRKVSRVLVTCGVLLNIP